MVKRLVAWGAMLLVLFALPLLQTGVASGSSQVLQTTTPQSPSGIHILTLPFADPRITVSQGWMYDWGSEHGGIDYMLGDRSTTNWQPFDVYAAADGWACGNCTNRQGNAIWIKHTINGQILYTYYGHLASFDPTIPVGSQQSTAWVQKGQRIGVSGNTGADVIHLHFAVYTSNSRPVDPYDLWTTREVYAPGCAQCRVGDNNLWTTNPPTLASGVTPPFPENTPALPTNTPVLLTSTPVPTPTKVSCTIKYNQTVEGVISTTNPETRYCLATSAGDWVSIRMFALQGSSLDTYVKLYAPDGSPLASDDDGAQVDSNSFMVRQLTKSGVYQVVATRYTGRGPYRLRIEKGSKSALGDLNGDCVVDKTDIQLMAAAVANNDLAADLNLDGSVDEQDQTIQNYRLGRGCMKIK